jgi:hypothetical protein
MIKLSSSVDMNVWSYSSTPPYFFMAWCFNTGTALLLPLYLTYLEFHIFLLVYSFCILAYFSHQTIVYDLELLWH